jgi:hypothetical protein
MRTARTLTICIALLVICQAGLAIESVTMLPPSSSDLVAGQLTSVELTDQVRAMDRTPVQFSWALADQKLSPPAPFVASSRSYWFDVSATELRDGVAIDVLGPGALVRLNPITRLDSEVDSDQRHAIDPANLELVTPAKSQLRGAAAMELMADVAQLEAADAPYAEGTSAFKLRSELGAGHFVLRAPQLDAKAQTRYFIQVFDRESNVHLDLSTGRQSYLTGQTLDASIKLAARDAALDIDTIQAELRPPTGAPVALNLAKAADDGSYRAGAVLPEVAGSGLWELHAVVTARVGGMLVRRNVRTAFGCAVPTARLTGTVAPVESEGLALSVGVEVSSAGRYEVRGILFADTGEAEMQPVGVAHSAAWLEPGIGAITLKIDSKVVAGIDAATYEIRDLQLLDQGRMGVLHRQDRGIVVR